MAPLTPEGDPDLTIFIALTILGFLVGIAGHINKNTAMIIIGIVLIFAATVALPLIVFGNGTG